MDGSAKPRRRRRLRRLLIGMLLLVVAGTASTAGYVGWAMGGSGDGTEVRVVVHEGDSGAQIAQTLQDEGVVRSALVFRVIARLRGVAGDFKPGVYQLRSNLGVSDAIEALRKGVPLKTFSFTIPEGKTLGEIARIVERNTPIRAKEFLRSARGGSHEVPVAGADPGNLEGLLFPKTYEIAEKTTADQLVRLLLTQFEKEAAAIDFAAKARSVGLTPYEAVVLASLIEREARTEKDRPLISSVIHNRLNRTPPMRLQIDATVQYAIFLKTGSYKFPLTFADLKFSSPYNTYLIDGLPPGPIAAPGAAALRAAVEPASTRYLYYLTTDNRSHRFFETGEEFNRALRNR